MRAIVACSDEVEDVAEGSTAGSGPSWPTRKIVELGFRLYAETLKKNQK